MTVLVSPAALADVDAAVARLNRERAGYGDALTDLFAAAVATIRSTPRRFPRADDGPDGVEVREAFLDRFEYRVLFALRDADTAEVLAVVHAHRKPGSWRRRLSELN